MSELKNIFKDKIVLVMDDNEQSRNSLKIRFEARGAITYTSSTLERSLVLLKGMLKENKLPDLVVMDLRLPECYGLHALKSIYPYLEQSGCPILVMSNGFNSVAISQMVFHGVVGYVEKPVLTEKLFHFASHIFSLKTSHNKNL